VLDDVIEKRREAGNDTLLISVATESTAERKRSSLPSKLS
jgi:hypothetical protein